MYLKKNIMYIGLLVIIILLTTGCCCKNNSCKKDSCSITNSKAEIVVLESDNDNNIPSNISSINEMELEK